MNDDAPRIVLLYFHNSLNSEKLDEDPDRVGQLPHLDLEVFPSACLERVGSSLGRSRAGHGYILTTSRAISQHNVRAHQSVGH